MPLSRIMTHGDWKAGIWHITEISGQMTVGVNTGRTDEERFSAISSDLRKRQWLACRRILKEMLPNENLEIIHSDAGKPFLKTGNYHISFSHSGHYAAAVISKTHRVGTDIEIMKERIQRVREKFLDEEDLKILGPDPELEKLYLFWCGKEALYKLNGSPDLDFKKDIHIHLFDYLCATKGECPAILSTEHGREPCMLYYEKIADIMLAVAIKNNAE